ncbi:MAG: DUF116 domain-containing protein [Deltaproteobacteria bacterium]|nr:DUF116 domain-containing protein [Deltaproteobacteria bacterium]
MPDNQRLMDGGNTLRPQKRIFLGLLAITCLLFALLLGVLWYVPYVGLTSLHPRLPLILGFFFTAILALIFAGVAILAFTVLLGRDLPFSRSLRGILVKFLLPLMSGVGKLFGVSKDQVRKSFIEINNQLLLAQHPRAAPEKVLLLMPHCLQFHECQFRITGNVVHCKRCGKCPIKGLAELSEKYGVGLAVATGGTLARRIVVERRPRLIIAVACERDLTSGIQDSYPLPVFGIINSRPHGPCFDTLVNLDRVEEALQTFLFPSPDGRTGTAPADPPPR